MVKTMKKNIIKLLLVAIFSVGLIACSAQETQQSSQQSSSSVVSQVPESSSVPASESSSQQTQDVTTQEVTVLKTATIQDGDHDVSATIEFMSDGTFTAKGFTYDGKAPDTYIALGSYDDEGEFVYEALVSPIIEGAYDNQDISFSLPEDIALEDYTAVSVWCHRFTEDFGSAELV